METFYSTHMDTLTLPVSPEGSVKHQNEQELLICARCQNNSAIAEATYGDKIPPASHPHTFAFGLLRTAEKAGGTLETTAVSIFLRFSNLFFYSVAGMPQKLLSSSGKAHRATSEVVLGSFPRKSRPWKIP